MNKAIVDYNESKPEDRQAICYRLAEELQLAMPDGENKIWHAHPVWFIHGNPVAGYDVLKDSVRLFFWSGQSFDEPGLTASGTFKAAEIRYTDVDQINSADVQRWLKKAQTIQWDYKNIVKRRGVLERLK